MGKKRICETCEKLNRLNGECRVLNERTDWQIRAIKAVAEYKKQKREKK